MAGAADKEGALGKTTTKRSTFRRRQAPDTPQCRTPLPLPLFLPTSFTYLPAHVPTSLSHVPTTGPRRAPSRRTDVPSRSVALSGPSVGYLLPGLARAATWNSLPSARGLPASVNATPRATSHTRLKPVITLQALSLVGLGGAGPSSRLHTTLGDQQSM